MTTPSAPAERRGESVPATSAIDVRVLGPATVADTLSIRRYASELTTALNALDGVEATRALAQRDGQPPSARESGRVASLPGRLRRRALRPLRPMLVRRQARRTRGDLFHLVDQRDAGLIKQLPAGRTVQTVHDLIGIGAHRPSRAHEVEQLRSGLAQAGHLVAVSESTRAEILEYIDVADTSQISVIANGIDDHFRPIPPARLAAVHDLLPPAHFRLLHVASNAQPRKNLSTTIRVLHELRRQGLDVILVRAGAPLPEAEQSLASDLGVATHVASCGYVSEDGLVELYNASDALLFPSRYEGFGWPPIEAMACGLPVVAAPIPSLQDTAGTTAPATISNAALVAGPDDIEALAAHAASVLTDSDLAATLRERGFARAAEYSWDRTARAYLEIYRTLIDR